MLKFLDAIFCNALEGTNVKINDYSFKFENSLKWFCSLFCVCCSLFVVLN